MVRGFVMSVAVLLVLVLLVLLASNWVSGLVVAAVLWLVWFVVERRARLIEKGKKR